MNKNNNKDIQKQMPSYEEVAAELGKTTSIDVFYGKEHIEPIWTNFKTDFSSTLFNHVIVK